MNPVPHTIDLDSELAFLSEAHHEAEFRKRLAICSDAINAGQPAPLTSAELTWAGRIAWRNHSRCIGRLHWRSLAVRDHRHLSTPGEIVESLRDHLVLAQGGGNIRSILTVFAPRDPASGVSPRIWNHQLCAYAGYRARDESILGDPKNAAFTELAIRLGWEPPAARSAFDLLPWIVAGTDGSPKLFPAPTDIARELVISHPKFSWFEKLGLRWYAVPVISDMRFHAAATDFPAAPFNGWYMSTEIASRDFSDTNRYNMLPVIASHLGLECSRSEALWRDRAMLELNEAVLHSYAREGVRLVDHHTASEEFMRFRAREEKCGRDVSARWDWIVPPMSSSATPVFHTTMREFPSTPDFHAQDRAWESWSEQPQPGGR